MVTARTFAYTATRFEGLKIACYDAESSGFFHAHLHEVSCPGAAVTAGKRFALLTFLYDQERGNKSE